MATFDGTVLSDILFPSIISFIIVILTTPLFARLMRKAGVVGIDVHKLHKPAIPEMGGVAILLGLTASSLAFIVLKPSFAPRTSTFLMVIGIAALVGAVDAVRTWGGKEKVLVTAAASIPIIVLGVYAPTPQVPFVGHLRMTLLYPIVFIPVFIALLSNATNMIDVLNGSMPTTVGISAAFLLAISIFQGKAEAAVMLGLLLAALGGFYFYNRYPARVFDGDVGSLSVGAAMGAIGIMYSLEIPMLITLLTLLVNGSLNLASVGRLFERREIKNRPIILLDDGKLAANSSKEAPITLTRLLLAGGPLREFEVVRSFSVLSILSGILGLLTAFLLVI